MNTEECREWAEQEQAVRGTKQSGMCPKPWSRARKQKKTLREIITKIFLNQMKLFESQAQETWSELYQDPLESNCLKLMLKRLGEGKMWRALAEARLPFPASVWRLTVVISRPGQSVPSSDFREDRACEMKETHTETKHSYTYRNLKNWQPRTKLFKKILGDKKSQFRDGKQDIT